MIWVGKCCCVFSQNLTPDLFLGTWSKEKSFEKANSYEHSEIPRFFRIGTVPTTPWAYKKRDDKGNVMMDDEGDPILEGYLNDKRKLTLKCL